ncbi:MAG: DUF692 domain-containing protein [Pseudomonadota bacterium]|nr:DUF692 domain-containing protein [Pseudomonadota bacterium]
MGLRTPHYRELLDTLPPLGWFEVHSENYFGDGGQPLYFLERFRSHYPLSLHGVGLSLGSTDALNSTHLHKLKSLVDRFEPGLVSDHLCWSSVGGQFLNDLLPLPYTEEALNHVVTRIGEAQDYLRRQILVENVSSYLQYKHSTIPEWEFLGEAARRAGCGILLDVNNIYVSAKNHHFDPGAYIDAIPAEPVQEIHLAGFDTNGDCLIDTHGKPVFDAVWPLYAHAIERLGPKPTLIEWDTDIPALEVLLAEAWKAREILERRDATVGA